MNVVLTKCRMCFTLCDENELQFMLTERQDSINLWSMYEYIMNGEDVVNTMENPHICLKCKDELQSAYFFKLMCSETERALSEMAKTDQCDDEFETKYVPEFPDVNEPTETVTLKIQEEHWDTSMINKYDSSDDDVSDDLVDGERIDKDLNRINTMPVAVHRKCRTCSLEFRNTTEYQAHYRKFHRRPHRNVQKVIVEKGDETELIVSDDRVVGDFRISDTLEMHEEYLDTTSVDKYDLSDDDLADNDDGEKSEMHKSLIKTNITPIVTGRKCKACSMEFGNTTEYQAHYRKFHRLPYRHTTEITIKSEDGTELIISKEKGRRCTTCDIHYDTAAEFMRHYRRFHRQHKPRGPMPKVVCPHCGIVFSKHSINRHVQNMHSAIKKRDYACNICAKAFSYAENLNMHMRIHANDKRFSCEICGEKFLHWASRRSHVRLKHTGEKSYECHLCGQKFAHSSNLHRHVRRHTNELRYSCSTCSKRFLTKDELNCHLVVHTKEKNEVCEICSKCFGTRKNLAAHMRIHTGERNYACTVCDKRFTQAHVLRTHLKTHPGVEMPERGVTLSQKALKRQEDESKFLIDGN